MENHDTNAADGVEPDPVEQSTDSPHVVSRSPLNPATPADPVHVTIGNEADPKKSQYLETRPIEPTLAELGFRQLDPNYIPADRITGLIFTAVMVVGAIVGLIAKFFHGGLDQSWMILAIVALAILLPLLWSAIFWPNIEYRHVHWRLDKTGLEIHRGVVWKRRTSVPLARVQHADVSQGPIQRSYGLGTLIVHTAGTVGASVDLSGLNYDVAIDLRDRLVRQRKADDGPQ